MSKVKEIAQSCIERWGEEDESTKNFSNKVGKFISQVDDKETGEILLDLLQEYNYYSRSKVNEILGAFYIKIQEFNFPKESTIYSRIEKDDRINSSSNLLEEFKIINNIGNNYSYDITKMPISKLNSIEVIIFMDDIIGSGNTIINFFKENNDKIVGKNIIILCIEIMKEGKLNIEKYLESVDCQAVIIPYKETEKAFSINGIFNEKSEEKKKRLVDFEKRHLNANVYVLGYKQSQALTTFYRNTPNNTISSYWLPQKKWKPLFPRMLDKPDFSKRNNIKFNLAKVIKEKGIDISCVMT